MTRSRIFTVNALVNTGYKKKIYTHSTRLPHSMNTIFIIRHTFQRNTSCKHALRDTKIFLLGDIYLQIHLLKKMFETFFLSISELARFF